MTSINIRPVRNSRDWKDFIKIKEEIYGSLADVEREAQEEIAKLQVFRKKSRGNQAISFVAEGPEGVLGRITAIMDEEHHNQQEGFFGFFESVNEIQVAKALLKAAANELYQWGKKRMIGPISPTTNDKVGIITQGFEILPHPNLNYNPPYYQKLLEKNGLFKSMGLLSYLWDSDTELPRHFTLLANQAVRNHEISLYFPARRSLRGEAPILQEVYNESLKGNWGFVPLSLREAEALLYYYKKSKEPDFLFYLMLNGEVAGLALLQDNVRRGLGEDDPRVRVAVLGLKPKYRRKGLSTILILKIVEFLESRGHDKAELSLIMENNQVVRGLIEKTLGHPILHRYQVYQCQLPL